MKINNPFNSKPKIIFLDLDGVMNNEIFFIMGGGNRKTNDYSDQIDPRCIENLNNICKETNAEVVLSSAWRITAFEEKVLESLGFNQKVLDYTPRLNSRYRGIEIQRWIDDNVDIVGKDFTDYVILDDDSDMLYHQRHNFFWVDGYAGLTHNMAYKVIRFLNGCGRGA